MKIPKRLPKKLQELVDLENAFHNLTLIAAEMRRWQGRVSIQLTYFEESILGDAFVTLDSDLFYDKRKKEVRESASSQTRRADIYRKAVLAS